MDAKNNDATYMDATAYKDADAIATVHDTAIDNDTETADVREDVKDSFQDTDQQKPGMPQQQFFKGRSSTAA